MKVTLEAGAAFNVDKVVYGQVERLMLQSSAMGALPTLRAAVDREASGGEYYGPGGFSEQSGHPVRVDSSKRSKDREVAERLWRVSQELTGVEYDFS